MRWGTMVAVLCTAEAGCAVDAGVRGGATFAKEGGSGNLSGGVGASIKYPLTGPGWTLGTEIQGRGEMERGSRWLGGLRAGYAHPPDPYRGTHCCGWELRAEGGTTLESATLFTQGRFTPPVEAVYPFAKAADAHAAVEQGGRRGKIVLSDGR